MLQSKLKGLNAKPLYWSFELAQVYSWCVDVSGRGQVGS
ncbi:unnamed protein product [Brugia timori]|uniref:Transposase n=1 Tax=Brugia timori TaxID=42155 RepID=A0A0R3Q520_9BILA|nr:unnamed protein product [Brugia timori]